MPLVFIVRKTAPFGRIFCVMVEDAEGGVKMPAQFKRRREQQEYIQQLILQKQTNALAENWAGIFTPLSASSTMTQKILPNGAVFLATKTSGIKRENPQPVF